MRVVTANLRLPSHRRTFLLLHDRRYSKSKLRTGSVKARPVVPVRTINHTHSEISIQGNRDFGRTIRDGWCTLTTSYNLHHTYIWWIVSRFTSTARVTVRWLPIKLT